MWISIISFGIFQGFSGIDGCFSRTPEIPTVGFSQPLKIPTVGFSQPLEIQTVGFLWDWKRG